jgi:Uma2 family endonuclease
MSPAAEQLENEHYTYADILQWEEGGRYELFDGEALMLAAPSRVHQEVLGALFNRLYNFLEGKTCKVYPAPFGVRLFPREDDSDDVFFEPDITVICDPAKLDDRGCKGAPDLVVEILSPSSLKNDLLYKLNKYLEAGVREYWIVDPGEKTLSVNILEQGRYTLKEYAADAEVEAAALPGFRLELKSIFPR